MQAANRMVDEWYDVIDLVFDAGRLGDATTFAIDRFNGLQIGPRGRSIGSPGTRRRAGPDQSATAPPYGPSPATTPSTEDARRNRPIRPSS